VEQAFDIFEVKCVHVCFVCGDVIMRVVTWQWVITVQSRDVF